METFRDGFVNSRRGRHGLGSGQAPIQVIRGKWYRVKRLVADAFILNPDGKRRLRHINGDTHDCRVTNLEWW